MCNSGRVTGFHNGLRLCACHGRHCGSVDLYVVGVYGPVEHEVIVFFWRENLVGGYKRE
jgi:hypothetical protein